MAYADSKSTKAGTSDTKLLEQAKARFKLAQEAEEKQRQREVDDLRFQVPEQQWDEAARRQRLGLNDGGAPVPARPVLSIPKLDQPIQIVLNQERNAHLGVSIQPLSADADPKVAEILEGLYRRIERDSQASDGRSWAFARAVMCGRGVYRVITEYDDGSDNPTDQVIRIKRILHQEAVYFDPAAQEADFSDGRFVFIASWVPLDDFKKQYPKAQVSAEGNTFEDMVTEAPEWVRGEGETAAVLVVEYYYKDKTYEPMRNAAGKEIRQREVVKVLWCKHTGFEVLEKEETPGKWLPVIPVIGRELQPFDAERRWTGVIGPAKDAQRLYNYAASSAVELAALEPKAPYIGAEGQFEGHETEWQQANVRNWPYLEYKPTTFGGQPVAPPQRAQVDVGRLGPSMQLLQQADQFIQITTATYDPSLGRESKREKSGRAIMAMQEQGEQSSSHYMQNLARSMAYEAKVVLDLIPSIYDRPGRLARTLDEEDESETVMLNQPFYSDPQTKMPVPMQEGEQPPMPPGPPMPPQGPGPGAMMSPPLPPAPPEVKNYDLRKGIYSVAVSIGKTRQTALQEGAEEIGAILQSNPELMPLIGPLYFKYRDFPGARELSDLMAKVRDKQFPGLNDDKDGKPTLEQAQAKVQQLEQQTQQMQQVMQEMQKALETEQAKQQATLQKADMDNRADLQKSDMDNTVKVQIAEMQAQVQMAIAQLKAEAEQQKLEMQAMMQERQAAMGGMMDERKQAMAGHQKERELAIGGEQREREMALGAGEKDREADRAEGEAARQREHEARMPVIQASVAPKPKEPKE